MKLSFTETFFPSVEWTALDIHRIIRVIEDDKSKMQSHRCYVCVFIAFCCGERDVYPACLAMHVHIIIHLEVEKLYMLSNHLPLYS